MTPEPNGPSGGLDAEIEAALDGVDLQSLTPTDELPASGGPRKGDSKERLYTGIIQGISGDDVIVELGPRMQGVVSLREFDEKPELGSKHQFTLRGREDELWLLSMRDAKAIASWNELSVGSTVKARVTGQNQGGLELKIGSNSAFMPSSQVSLDRNEDIAAYIGQTILAEVLEINRERKRVVLSRRKQLERDRDKARSESADKFQPGMVLNGKVTRVEAFGAFVDIDNGLEGMVHVSNISRKRVENPADLLKKGQEVKVQVLQITEGGRRISLGMKQLEPDPWADVDYKYNIDAVYPGKVMRLMDFGAFIELEPGIEGLLHVSQLGPERVRRIQDHLKLGDEVSVRVQEIDPSAQRISLSKLDSRGAVIGSEDSVDSEVIDEALKKASGGISTNLGSIFKDAFKKK
ncbi:MAG: ribosomal protein S1 [Chlamydiales bacterium]|jgi:ribosomal protein S1